MSATFTDVHAAYERELESLERQNRALLTELRTVARPPHPPNMPASPPPVPVRPIPRASTAASVPAWSRAPVSVRRRAVHPAELQLQRMSGLRRLTVSLKELGSLGMVWGTRARIRRMLGLNPSKAMLAAMGDDIPTSSWLSRNALLLLVGALILTGVWLYREMPELAAGSGTSSVSVTSQVGELDGPRPFAGPRP